MRFRLALLAVVVSVSSFAGSQMFQPWLINAKEAAEGQFPAVVWIESSSGMCTATIVGPRTIITASHCAEDKDIVTFEHKGETYKATATRSALYETDDHDIALALVDKVIVDATPVSVGKKIAKGKDVVIAGFGCITPSLGTGGNDGILRFGASHVTGFRDYDMVLNMEDGAAGCFGDSGGPVFLENTKGMEIVGVHSKANISDTTYSSRLDHADSVAFMKEFAKTNKVDICGVTKVCN